MTIPVTCPKCGSEKKQITIAGHPHPRPGARYAPSFKCGSHILLRTGDLYESAGCLRRQLEVVSKRANRAEAVVAAYRLCDSCDDLHRIDRIATGFGLTDSWAATLLGSSVGDKAILELEEVVGRGAL